jgi:hypothetical protein
VLTLAEALKLRDNPIDRGILEEFVLQSPLLDRLPVKVIGGNSYSYNREATLPNVAFRGVNSSYTESTGTVNPATEVLTILGGESDVDEFLVETQPGNNPDLRAVADAALVKSLSYKFQDSFFNGDTAVDANSFDGLKKRLTGPQVIDSATNGLPVIGASTDDRQAFIDQLDALIAAVPGCNALYMDGVVKTWVLSALRRERVHVGEAGGGIMEKPQVEAYRGIPLLEAGERPDGTKILPATETMGTSAGNTGSIYAVKFGRDVQDRGVTALGTREGLFKVKNLGELQSKPAERTRVEGYPGLAVFSGKAAARLRGLRRT